MRTQFCGITLCVLVACGVASQSAAQNQPPRRMNTYEQNAIKVVSAWTAAWQANDPEKMAQYVADDIKFRLDPSEPTTRTGRQAFLCQMRGMGAGGLGNLVIKDTSYQAVGDKVYTLVVQRRTDVIQPPPGGARGARGAAPGGPGRPGGPGGPGGLPALAGDIPAGAFFVVKNGKIAEWLDVALALDITTLQGGVPPTPPCN